MERQRRRGPACGPLVLVLALFVPMAPAAHAQAAPVSTVDVGGVVTSRAGVPLEGATVTVEQTRFTTDAAGRWQGRVPFVRLFHEWASAPGYRGDRLTTFTVTPPGGAMTRLVDALPSVFEPDPRYATLPDTTPPTITTFATDAGVANAQELPVDTQLLTVAGTVGSHQGRPLVRGDAYLAHPDDSVEQAAVHVDGETFSVTFALAQGPGKYQVEVNDSSGAAIVNVPLFLGVPYQPDRPPATLANGPADPEASKRQAMDELNSLRTSHGLAALEVDPRLTGVADDHLQDMLAHRWSCHCWSDGSDLLGHLKAAGLTAQWRPVAGRPGYTTAILGEGLAEGASGAGAIRGLWSSPGHRLDLLGPYTHAGVATGRSGNLTLFVIEYLDEGA